MGVALRGHRTEGPMQPDIPLDRQRPAQYVFARHVEKMLDEIHAAKPSKAGKARPPGPRPAQPTMTAAE
jgi:hypothetical protein